MRVRGFEPGTGWGQSPRLFHRGWMPAFNPGTREVEAEMEKFEASLGYILHGQEQLSDTFSETKREKLE